MITKYVQIEFVDPRIYASDRILDIQKAVDYVSESLENRLGIILLTPKVYNFKYVISEINLPDECSDLADWKIAQKFRGISAYLYKTWPNTYEKYRKSNDTKWSVLLTYKIIKKPKMICTSVDDRILAYKLVSIMHKKDPTSVLYVNQILDIMNEYENYCEGEYADNG